MQHDFRNVVFASPRLLIRAFRHGDVADAFRFGTATISRFMTWNPSPSLQTFTVVTESWQQMMAAGTDLFAVARERSDESFVGVVGLHCEGHEPEIGIWVREDLHRRGYGREAIVATIAWARETLGATSFLYPVVTVSEPSRRLAESLGGSVVGTRELAKPGGTLDEVVYRLPANGVASGPLTSTAD
ncbi:MAG: GNAT family N-acetyltransferase [Variibacter sp.]